MAKIKVYLDTDVVISSLISQKGASYELIQSNLYDKYISNYGLEETEEVSRRHSLSQKKLNDLLKYIKVKNLELTQQKLIDKYSDYVFDVYDTPVIASAHILKTRYLVTFNTKHYNIFEIRKKLKIAVLTPGRFLQFLRGN